MNLICNKSVRTLSLNNLKELMPLIYEIGNYEDLGIEDLREELYKDNIFISPTTADDIIKILKKNKS